MTTQSVHPLFFGQSGQRLFGTYHPPSITSDGIALLICAPLGHEDLCAYKSLRQVAEAAAKHNVPAMRFDYAGCGNSEGDEQDPGLLNTWLSNIAEACSTLRQLSGAQRVVLLGLRLGGMLATLAAPLCEGVCDVILIAPVVGGRAYLRELKALHLAGEAAQLMTGHAGNDASTFESGGFVLADETHAALSALDLLKIDTAPVSSMLLIDRDDLPVTKRFAAHMQAVGVCTDQVSIANYADMMADPHLAVTPPALLPIVLDRLKKVVHQSSPAPVAPLPQVRAAQSTTLRPSTMQAGGALIETITPIGGAPTLFGVLSTPADDLQQQQSHLGILFLNAGAIREVGPSRLYVKLARHWASEGCTTLRIDIAGLGDSPPHPGQPDNIVYSDTALLDVTAAIAHLRNQPGVNRVVLLGLCSGAYHAFKSTVHGQPVDATVVINPLTFFWESGTPLLTPAVIPAKVVQDMQRHRRSILHASTWHKLLRGQVSPQRLAQISSQSLAWMANKGYLTLARLLHLPIKNDLAGELEHVAQRGIQQHFVFSEHDPGLTLLRSFGGRTVTRLQKRQLLNIHLIARADHTFTMAGPRKDLVETLHAIIRKLSELRHPPASRPRPLITPRGDAHS
jgi:alpha-beta hydrolase superfamily lysophospholipase